MFSYKNDESLKANTLDRLLFGRGKSDGWFEYWFDFFGDDVDQTGISKHIGLPEWLCHFIAMASRETDGPTMQLITNFIAAIPVGVDLEPVKHVMAVNRLNQLGGTPYEWSASLTHKIAEAKKYHERAALGDIDESFSMDFNEDDEVAGYPAKLLRELGDQPNNRSCKRVAYPFGDGSLLELKLSESINWSFIQHKTPSAFAFSIQSRAIAMGEYGRKLAYLYHARLDGHKISKEDYKKMAWQQEVSAFFLILKKLKQPEEKLCSLKTH